MLVVFEGPDFSGKTSLINELYKFTRVYPIYLSFPWKDMQPMKNLMVAQNNQNFQKMICLEALRYQSNKLDPFYITLMDRWLYSTYVYQKDACGIKDYSTVPFWYDGIAKPDIVVYVDTKLNTILDRSQQRPLDNIEKSQANLKKMYYRYVELFGTIERLQPETKIIRSSSVTVDELLSSIIGTYKCQS
jgi:thymidylate kinase